MSMIDIPISRILGPFRVVILTGEVKGLATNLSSIMMDRHKDGGAFTCHRSMVGWLGAVFGLVIIAHCHFLIFS